MQNEDSKAGEAAPNPTELVLTVTAVVNVAMLEGRAANVSIKVDAEGMTGLVAIMRQHNSDLQAAGRILQGVVMRALSMEVTGPPIDLTRVGRA